MSVLTVQTQGAGLYEITDHLPHLSPALQTGLLHLFVLHTSASLLIQENADPSARADLEAFFQRFVPDADHPSQSWMTHILEGADDMPAHIKAMLLPCSLSVPVRNGQLALGTWQGIYLFEHRHAPHVRNIRLTFTPGIPLT